MVNAREDLNGAVEENQLIRIGPASKILGYSIGHTRRLFLRGVIPGYKPFGKKGALLFDPQELRECVKRSRVPTKKEIYEQASEILNANARKCNGRAS